ncbi:BTAD domain-containing putative transcriptional regulator [Streptomyces bacillaris]|uniref:AfsR/SARP family transcriptional regulator n=1 Tax=Streptomyces bacillaris TaxID=68179 RepID=UPI0036AE244D
MRELEFAVLGPLEVRDSGAPIRLTGMRRRRLLALLLLRFPHAVARESLVDALWETPPASARQQVHNAIRDLRAALTATPATAGSGAGSTTGSGVLATTATGYRLDVPPGAVDAHRFTEGARAARAARREGREAEAVRLFRSALDLWRGEAFAGIDCPAVTAAAAGLEEERLTAVEELTDLRLAAGESATLVAELSTLTAAHPLRDALRGHLMLALHRSGRQADALAVYDEGRRLLADELGLEPGRHLRRLHTEILTDAQEERRTPKPPTTDPAPATDAPTPTRQATEDHHRPTHHSHHGNHLPRDLPDFTGRTAELALLNSETDAHHCTTPLTSPAAPSTIVIDGMGGIGKTTLAIHFAHRRTPDHPDGQHYIDLHGFTPDRDPLTPEEALGILLRSDGATPEEIPAGPAERGAAWRSRLAGRRALLVLDNAADAAQVIPLLPGAGDTLTLITTRRKSAAPDGARRLTLGALRQEEAETLFRRVAGESRTYEAAGNPRTDRAEEKTRTDASAGEPRTTGPAGKPRTGTSAGEPRTTGPAGKPRPAASLARTVTLCGHHPLALRLAATRLRDRPSWTVPDLADRLSTPEGRTALLRTADRGLMPVLALSRTRLPAEAQRLAHLLALHPSTTHDIAAVCAITGLAAPLVEHLLDTLLDHNLADEPAPAHVALPLLVRDCAQSWTPPTEPQLRTTARRLTVVA